MTSVFFILILLVVSGFVAWAGDVLGSMLGKKRIALFNLRPRRTSMLITVITGALITAITIGALTLMSQDFRRMILEYDRVQDEFDALTEDRDQARLERDEARNELSAAHEQYLLDTQTFMGQLSTIKDEIVGYRDEVEVLTEEVGSLTSERDELALERDTIKADMEAQVAEKQSELDTLSDKLSDLTDEILGLTYERNELTEDVNTLTSQVNDLTEQVNDLRGQVQEYMSGTIKVYEGQQLVVIPIETYLDGTTIYELMRGAINRIPESYQDPVSGEHVLADNKIEIQPETYTAALEDIRAQNAEHALVIVYATENVMEGMDVPVRLEVTRNYKVYSEGTTIFSQTYSELEDATDPYRAALARFFEDASDSIVNDRRLIPYTSGEALQMPIDTLIELARELEDTGLPAEIKIVALKDIYRSDFLLYGDQFEVIISPFVSNGAE